MTQNKKTLGSIEFAAVRLVFAGVVVVTIAISPGLYPAARAAERPAATRTSVLFQRPFIKGIVAFNQKRYEDAIKLFRQALRVVPNDKTTLTYLMFAGFKAKNGPATVEGGEALIELGEDSSRTLFVTGKGQRWAGNETRARELFSIIAGREDDPYLDAAEFALAETGLNYRPRGLRGSVVLAYEHDDNIASSPSDSSVFGSAVEDSRWQVTAQALYDQRIGERFYLGGGLVGYSQLYGKDEAQPFEIDLARFNLHGGVVGQGWGVRLDAEHEDIGLDHKEFIDTERFKLTYDQKITRNYRITLIAGVADDDFPQSPLQDAIKSELEWRNRILLPALKEGAYVSVDYRYRDNDTNDTSRFSYDAHRIKLSLFSPLPWWSTYLRAEMMYEDRDYDEPTPTPAPARREDDIRERSVRIGKIWNKHLRNEVYHRRYVSDSTVDFFTYDQDTWGINLIYTF